MNNLNLLLLFKHSNLPKLPEPIIMRILVPDNFEFLNLAVVHNISWIIEFLNEQEPQFMEDVDRIMMRAISKGYFELVKYSHENGADINLRRDSPICNASHCGYYDIVMYLHKNGANIRAQANSPLRSACEKGYLDIVKYLCKHKANSWIRIDDFIDLANKMGHYHIGRYLANLR